MAGSAGSDTGFGKMALLLIFVDVVIVVLVLGVFHMGIVQLIIGIGAIVVIDALIVGLMVDSEWNDQRRRVDAHGSALKNMDHPPERSWKNKRQWASHHLTHGMPVPGPADLKVPHEEYERLATDPRYRGSQFTEPSSEIERLQNDNRGGGGGP